VEDTGRFGANGLETWQKVRDERSNSREFDGEASGGTEAEIGEPPNWGRRYDCVCKGNKDCWADAANKDEDLMKFFASVKVGKRSAYNEGAANAKVALENCCSEEGDLKLE
jgi:hypothetical protein